MTGLRLSGLGSVGGMGAQAVAGYDTASMALFARFSTPPTAARKALINNLVVALKAAGVWSKMDALYLTAAADNQAAQRNWVADAFNLTEAVAAPIFTADRGYQGNGSTQWIDTGFNPTTAVGPKFTQNSAHQGLWSRTSLLCAAGVSYDAGNANSRIGRRGNVADGLAANAAVWANFSANAVTANSYPGYSVWSRSSAALFETYGAGVDTGGGTTASAALTNANFNICRANSSNWGTNQIAAFHFGSNLTAAEVLAFNAALYTYLLGVGAV